MVSLKFSSDRSSVGRDTPYTECELQLGLGPHNKSTTAATIRLGPPRTSDPFKSLLPSPLNKTESKRKAIAQSIRC